MQSSQEFFCEECGAANPDDATYCFACKEVLTRSPASLPAPVPIKPIVISSPASLQVVAGGTLTTPHFPAHSVSSDSLAPGALLQNRYRIEDEIGQGGYSIVYRTRDTTRRNRLVTIKQINLRNLSSRQVIEATETFNRETTLLPGLKHEGIPRFYGHFTDPQHWYLVMEYIKGQTLEEYLQHSAPGGYLSLVETLRIGIALCSILEYLHGCKPPMIFRDIKPANIMLTPKKKVYLIDFGIARAFTPHKLKDTTPLGSPGYAAPEQYGRSQSDARTDIYGLGMTLRTLLTGRDPLELRAGEPSLAPQPIPPYLQKLLDSMTDTDPTLRPRTIVRVKLDLKSALAKTRWIFLYSLGAGLTFLFQVWGYLTILGARFGYLANELAIISTCLWGITAVLGLILLLIFLINSPKRSFALGALTMLLLAVFLFAFHIVPRPF